MLDPTGTLIPLLTEAVSTIPEVLALVNNDPDNIIGYSDSFPDSGDFQQTLYALLPPAILIAWMGTAPGRGRNELVTHSFSIFLRAEGSPGALFSALYNGTPSSSLFGSQRFRLATIHNSCDPIATLSCDRRFAPVDDRKVIDYFEIKLTLVERGVDR
jgi:hypothetical protein